MLASGTAVSGTSASYGGNLVATLVPEPETYAMLLAGLGALGFRPVAAKTADSAADPANDPAAVRGHPAH